MLFGWGYYPVHEGFLVHISFITSLLFNCVFVLKGISTNQKWSQKHNPIIVFTWNLLLLQNCLNSIRRVFCDKQAEKDDSYTFLAWQITGFVFSYLCSHSLTQQCSCASLTHRFLIATEPLARTESALVNWIRPPSDQDIMGTAAEEKLLKICQSTELEAFIKDKLPIKTQRRSSDAIGLIRWEKQWNFNFIPALDQKHWKEK